MQVGARSFSLCFPFIFPAQITSDHFITLNLACRRKENRDRRGKSARGRVKKDGWQKWSCKQFCMHTTEMFRFKPLPMLWGTSVMVPLLKEVSRKNRGTGSKGRAIPVSELYLWRYFKFPCWTGLFLGSVKQDRVYSLTKLEEGESAVPHFSADPSVVRQSPGWTFY